MQGDRDPVTEHEGSGRRDDRTRYRSASGVRRLGHRPGVATASGTLPIHDIYRRLVGCVPPGKVVASCVAGLIWTFVKVGDEGGLSATLHDGLYDSALPATLDGVEARRLAEHVAGWNMFEASLGLATVNACCNCRDGLERRLGRPLESGQDLDLFERLADRFEGGSVAVVGRFPGLAPLESRCRLAVLERQPSGADLPDQACEYVLPHQDCVLITGSAIANKTIPRLLELSRGAYVVLMGPSVPLVPMWFDYGVDLLAGSVVVDPEAAARAVGQGAHRRGFDDALVRVEITAEAAEPGDAATRRR